VDEEAKKGFELNVEYLRKEWSEKEVAAFTASIKHILDLLQRYPEMFMQSPLKPGVRKARVNKKIDLYYKYLPELGQVHLLTFWSVKRNPSDLHL
jgi:hypothetical protein